jgi:hypothetical protein
MSATLLSATITGTGVTDWSAEFSGKLHISIGNGVNASTGAKNTGGTGTFEIQYTDDDGTTAQTISKDVDGNPAVYSITASDDNPNVSVTIDFGETPVKARIYCSSYTASTKVKAFK